MISQPVKEPIFISTHYLPSIYNTALFSPEISMLLKLFLTFFRLGAVTFGGGYAMMALLEQELVENNDWMTGDELLEITAIAQITPGTIAINAATFVGRRMAGIPVRLLRLLPLFCRRC